MRLPNPLELLVESRGKLRHVELDRQQIVTAGDSEITAGSCDRTALALFRLIAITASVRMHRARDFPSCHALRHAAE